MALYILTRGQSNNSLLVAGATCFTCTNYGNTTNSTLSAATPLGVLGGSVAAVSGGASYTAVPCNLVTPAVGLFVNNAAGNAFENSPAVASGVVSIIKGMASVEVDVYETYGCAHGNTAATAYAVGDKLYSSAYGLLTNNASTDATVIGIVTKIPTVASPNLGLDMRI